MEQSCVVEPQNMCNWSASPRQGLTSQDPLPVPGAIDIKRLLQVKAETERRLASVRARVNLLSSNDQRLRKEINKQPLASHGNNHRQSMQEALHQKQQEQNAHEQALKSRAANLREKLRQSASVPRVAKLEEKKAAAEQLREDSKRLQSELHDARERARQSKIMQVEVQKQKRRQQQLRRELEATRREQARQDANALKYAELQEDLLYTEHAVASAEREEILALSRLRNSQQLRTSKQLQVVSAFGQDGSGSEQKVQDVSGVSTVLQGIQNGHRTESLSSQIAAGLGQIEEGDEPTPSPTAKGRSPRAEVRVPPQGVAAAVAEAAAVAIARANSASGRVSVSPEEQESVTK